MIQKGIDPVETGSLWFVPAGDPRRVFMGGGSDAHGDFNYRREGYLTGTTRITDTAIAKVRNLVFAGAPADTKSNGGVGVHTQEQIFGALGEGNFTVTDGPALRIAIDRNGNGVIDPADTPMGGIVELNGEATLPLLVEWKSSAEFGAVDQIQLYVGVQNGGGVDGRTATTYAIKAHGPRSEGVASSDIAWSYDDNGLTYARMQDGYTMDPTGLLSVATGSTMSGVRKINLPIAAFETAKGVHAERMYVRAFAETTMKDQTACLTVENSFRSGACIRRYAFTNPIWAIPAPKGKGGVCTRNNPRAIDRDGDGIPDGCDPCPDTRATSCTIVKPPITKVGVVTAKL